VVGTFSEDYAQDAEGNARSVPRPVKVRLPRAGPSIARRWDAEQPCDLMDGALTQDGPLEAHLWCTVVQSDAKVQPVFRLYRNHYTRSDDLEPARRGARGQAPRTPGRAHPQLELTIPRRSASRLHWVRSRR
jgi:hypothetical protein